MRRLAIIDVATGQQPIFNEDGTVAVVFNGEIYNYIELRADAAACRAPILARDHSDTEVIVHLYEEHGLDFLHSSTACSPSRCGTRAGRSSCSRVTGSGIKPLYLARVAGGVAFGSEPKALLEHPEVSREPEPHWPSTTIFR